MGSERWRIRRVGEETNPAKGKVLRGAMLPGRRDGWLLERGKLQCAQQFVLRTSAGRRWAVCWKGQCLSLLPLISRESFL